MTNLGELSIRRPVYPWLIILICLLGGFWGLGDIGRLEDPEFTIKQAKVYTAYPGAAAEKVEEEVTENLEVAIQQLKQLKRITSISRPGLSEITVEIQDGYDSATLPQIWDELRRKVRDAESSLPRAAQPPVVNDDFGDVYGIYYAVTAPGFNQTELREIMRQVRRELLTVDGVARVITSGLQDEVAYLEINESRLAQFGFSLDEIGQLLQGENTVPNGGETLAGPFRPKLRVDSQASDLEAIQRIVIGQPGSTALVHIDELADISLGYDETPSMLAKFDGERAVMLGVSAAPNTNIVDVGHAVEARLDLIKDNLPLGVDVHPVYQQHTIVAEAVNGFLINLASSVIIVVLVLCLFMGWRSGVVVGVTLGLTVMGTVLIMNLLGLNLQRISLGALIIAMGMLVDNAIVVAEGTLMGVQQRLSPLEASKRIIKQTNLPLLGATVIGIMAFSGIGLSQDSTGEFLFSLFAVIGISLLLSWLLAITVTPYLSNFLFKGIKPTEGDPYGKGVYRRYRDALNTALHHRVLTVVVLVLVTFTSYWAFGFVKQGFFPNSNAPMFYVNYWLPQGTDIHETEDALDEATAWLRQREDVVNVTSVAGRGADRFMLTYAPESPNTSYGQLIVKASARDAIPAIIDEFMAEVPTQQPNTQVMPKRIVFGPGDGADEEVRLSGPDPKVLRRLAHQAESIFREHNIQDIRHDWRTRETSIRAKVNEERSRIAGVSNQDIARMMQFANAGYRVADYERGERTIPIVAHINSDARYEPESLEDRLVWSQTQREYLPAGQVVDRFDTEAEEGLIHRRNRVRTLTVMGDAPDSETAMSAFAKLRPDVEAIELPPGYRLEWGGEFENTRDAQASLGQGLPLGFLIMILITVLLFGTVREPVIIWLVVPMCLIGVVIGLLGTGMPFGFMSLLGVLSLSGMLIKNAVVLVDEIQVQIANGVPRMDAIELASTSRLRPVFLAAVTTVLGMSPLLFDAFFADMAVTIMGGLSFATLLTLIAVPVFYSLFHKVKHEERETQRA